MSISRGVPGPLSVPQGSLREATCLIGVEEKAVRAHHGCTLCVPATLSALVSLKFRTLHSY